MKAPAAPPSSTPRLVGWLIAAFVVSGPLLFLFLVTPREETPADPPARVAAPASPSRLAAVGLRENPDWDAMPEIFALWAGRAHWVDDRTRFAWWHPGAQRHAYFFEARRTATGVRFREIREPRDEAFEWDPQAADSPLRLYLPVAIDIREAPPLAPPRPPPAVPPTIPPARP